MGGTGRTGGSGGHGGDSSSWEAEEHVRHTTCPTLSALRYLMAVARSCSAAVDRALEPSPPLASRAAAAGAAMLCGVGSGEGGDESGGEGNGGSAPAGPLIGLQSLLPTLPSSRQAEPAASGGGEKALLLFGPLVSPHAVPCDSAQSDQRPELQKRLLLTVHVRVALLAGPTHCRLR